MEALNFDLLLRILVAHFLADFIFQPTSWVEKKNEHGIKSGYFWLHIGVHLVTLSILLWNLNLWPVIIVITVSHLILDAIKSQVADPIKRKFLNSDVWIFSADQFLHLLIIILVWLVYSKQIQLFNDIVSSNNQKIWRLILAYLVLSVPTSILIGKITQKWSNELKEPNEQEESNEKDGLKNDIGLVDAGKWIGIMERFLIFTFIAINQIGAIGFLLAAKSVFRFGDINNKSGHKKTEYIIIGTLISFSIAIAIGLIYKFIIK